MIDESITVFGEARKGDDSRRAHGTRETLVQNKIMRTLRRHPSATPERLGAVVKNIAERNLSVTKALADATHFSPRRALLTDRRITANDGPQSV